MKIRGRKPTREERKIFNENNLDTYVWLIMKNTPTFMEVVNRDTGEVKTITK